MRTPTGQNRGGGLRVVLGTALAVTLLTGCEVPTLEPGAAEELQSQVFDVSEAAAAGEYEQALSALDELSVRLDTASRLGDVSPSREERIRTAIEAVRMNLETEIVLGDS